MTRAVLAAVLVAAAPPLAGAQQLVDNPRIERRAAGAPLEREIAAAAAGGTAVWVAFNLRTIPSSRHRCPGSHVVLAPATELLVMVRVDAGSVQQVRSFTPECEVTVGPVPVLWLDGVSDDAGAAWLASLAADRRAAAEWRRSIGDPALGVLAVASGQAAVTALVALARVDERPRVRSQALIALAQRASDEAAQTIHTALQQDPELEVKRQAVYALSRLPADEGVPRLIEVARTHASLDVRRHAMLYLGRSNDPRAAAFFEDVLVKSRER